MDAIKETKDYQTSSQTRCATNGGHEYPQPLQTVARKKKVSSVIRLKSNFAIASYFEWVSQYTAFSPCKPSGEKLHIHHGRV
ncbi:hypothetical protein GUJ93_ZPchr0009g104 [Zizania palustris]|uniref:Uncharacterized protein n=1 Tax=Zizania palustris TaxID=103762 RepID=A0A8J5V6U8_ZIZPA|nr:hypothetical protein GUJ93_ZPchr0009g104 [Zizania palustris]